jgi:hypothetical protein
MPRSAVIRLYRPGPVHSSWLAGWNRYYSVLIDGIDVGEVWMRQSKVFDVTPGDHVIGGCVALTDRRARVSQLRRASQSDHEREFVERCGEGQPGTCIDPEFVVPPT